MDDPPLEMEHTEELRWFRHDGVAMCLRITSTGLVYSSQDPYLGFQTKAGFQTFGDFLLEGPRFGLPEALAEVLRDEVEDLAEPGESVSTALEPLHAPTGVTVTQGLDSLEVQLSGRSLSSPWVLLGLTAGIAALLALTTWLGEPGIAVLGVLAGAGMVAWLAWGRGPVVKLDSRQLTLEQGRLRRRRQRIPLENIVEVRLAGRALVVASASGERASIGQDEPMPVLVWLADGIERAARLRRESVGSETATQAPPGLESLLDR